MAKSWNDLSAPIQGAIFVAGAAALAGLVFYFYVWPLSDKIDGLQKQVAKIKAENDQNEAVRQKQIEYLNRIKQLGTQLDTLRSIVPDEPAVGQFMETVFADAASTNTHIRSFTPKPTVVKEFYVEMPFTLRLDGTYYGFVNFFNKLAGEQRITNVSSLDEGKAEGGGKGSYKVSANETIGTTCVLTTYYNKPLTGAAPPPKKK